MTRLKSQLARYAGALPLYAAPALSGAPYIAPDLQSGDVVDFVNIGIVSVVYPTPTTTNTIFVNGANKGASPYTLTAADVTAGNLTVYQRTANPLNFSDATSASVNPIAPPTAWAQDLIGGNASGATYYSVNQFLNNGGQAGVPPYPYQTTSGTYAGSYDALGWPTSAFSVQITAGAGGLDGQLLAGTYACSYRSTGQGTSLTGGTGVTISGITNTNPVGGGNDGVTTYFTLTLTLGANAYLDFNGGVQYLNIPRDFTTQTYGGPEFWPTMLAYYAKFSTVRLMDVCRPNNGTEKVWADRLSWGRYEGGVTQPGRSTEYSWDRIFRLINAMTAYPGSRIKKIHLAIPGLLDPTQPNASNYAYQLPTLANTVLAGNTVEIELEVGDEPWNPTLNGGPIFAGNLHSAQAELKVITLTGGNPAYGSNGNPVISSIVSNGDGTATVTTTSPLNAIPLADGSGTFAITNGMAMVAYNSQNNGTWGAGSVVKNANPLLDATVTTANVTVGSPTGTTFTYACSGGSLTAGTVMPASGHAFFFNTASNLIKDGISLDLYNIGRKCYARRFYGAQQVWSAIRPQDKFVYNIQNSGFAASSTQVEYQYSQYVSGSLTLPWAYGSCLAPYVNPTAKGVSANAGDSFLTNVPFVSTAQVGDAITITNAGAAGATLTTTVAAGSSGMTLNIATTVSTTNTNATVTVLTGPQANFTGYIVGTTLTVTSTQSGTVAAGMMFNGTPATMALNTKILSGSGSTFTVSISQNVGSSGSPVSMVAANTDGVVGAMQAAIPSFAASLAAHIYQCNLFGLRPMCYEGGPATEFNPAPQQVAIHTNPAMGGVVTSLLNAWFSQGGKEFQAYGIGPATLLNAQEGAWPFLQSYSDLSSPKIAALLAFSSQSLTYGSYSSSPMTGGPTGTAGAYVAGDFVNSAGLTFNSTNGMVFSTSSANARFIDRMFLVARARRYQLIVKGSSTAADTLNVSVDGASVGSITLVANGDAGVNGTVPAFSAALNLTISSRGAKRIRLDFPLGTAAKAGVFSMALQAY